MRAAATFFLCLGLLAAPAAAQEGTGGTGQAVYEKYCSQCHGVAGDGVGVATPYLKPAPRDFTGGKYKIRRTATGELPLDEDLVRVVEVGLPYTAMPGFAGVLSAAEIRAVVDYVKAFSEDFQDPELAPEPFPIPEPPAYTPESVERGKQVYAETGCARCHGTIGYGDGLSAPTLVDDWGVHIRAADLSMPWTFRGGGTRRDVFRTMSSGFNGTPMPGFHGSLPVEDIWAMVDYIVSLSGNSTEPPYASVVRAVGSDEPLDLAKGAELFAAAPKAMLPLVGQIVEKGRNFYPSTVAVVAQAVYDREEIAIRLTWHDMRAETWGTNAPDLQVPPWEEQMSIERFLPVQARQDGSAGEEGGDFWGDAAADEGEGGGFWGDAAADEGEGDSGDFWGEAAADEGEADESDSGDDFWGEAAADDGEGGADDFWGESDAGAGSAAAPEGPDTEFTDAVALQFPLTLPEGIEKPYFLFGDAQRPVELWFAEMGEARGATYLGRGSAAIAPGDGEAPEVVASYQDGEWSVIFKRPLESRGGISFEEGRFIPIAFSVWDGFNRERGNKRGVTAWYDLYLEPLERPSPAGPMLRAGLGVLVIEILIIALVRRYHRKKLDAGRASAAEAAPASA